MSIQDYSTNYTIATLPRAIFPNAYHKYASDKTNLKLNSRCSSIIKRSLEDILLGAATGFTIGAMAVLFALLSPHFSIIFVPSSIVSMTFVGAGIGFSAAAFIIYRKNKKDLASIQTAENKILKHSEVEQLLKKEAGNLSTEQLRGIIYTVRINGTTNLLTNEQLNTYLGRYEDSDANK